MEKINIDRKIAERADEFAEREYECGAEDRAHLSKGYYWGYKDAEKDLALTWEDMSNIHDIMIDLRIEEKFPPMSQQLYEEILRRFNEQRNELY